jgi:hypothetical protein
VSPFAGGHDGRGVMVMGRRGGATPHPATEPSAASSRFYAAGIAETVHLDTGDVRIFARRASHATMAKAREVTSPEAVHRYPTLAKECRLAGATRIQFRSQRGGRFSVCGTRDVIALVADVAVSSRTRSPTSVSRPRPTRCAVVLMRCCVPRLSKSARSQTDRT